MTNPEEISLDSVSKSFEYEKQARLIDECDDVNELRKMLIELFQVLHTAKKKAQMVRFMP